MIIKMFQPQFHAAVESGAKRQTIRPKMKPRKDGRPVKLPPAGAEISLRAWTGMPYRSKQRELRKSILTGTHRCYVGMAIVAVDGSDVDKQKFAEADGFESFEEMRDWFARTHGLPFEGTLYKWA